MIKKYHILKLNMIILNQVYYQFKNLKEILNFLDIINIKQEFLIGIQDLKIH